MQKKSTSHSAFFNARALSAVLLCATAFSIVTGTLPALVRSKGSAKVSRRTLTFAERVAYQHAIEDVYWRHRIWPKERPDPKPSLEAVMSQAQLEKKVADYLSKSQALEDYWQRPLTAEQLQAEMDRMAKHTKQPEVLRELFETLGNDPVVVAECLARPVLAERLLTDWYAHEQRIHGVLRQRAEAELVVHPTVEQMKQLSGQYTEIELLKSDSRNGEPPRSSKRSTTLNSRAWDEKVQNLAAIFGGVSPANKTSRNGQPRFAALRPAAAEAYEAIPLGKVSALHEDEMRYYATAVLNKTNDHLKLATVSWLKERLDSWLARAENQARNTSPLAPADYSFPNITAGGCTDNTWTAVSNVPGNRARHTAVWTGSEMIVWGGVNYGRDLNTGDKYNPATDTWSVTSITNAPEARSGQTAVWTGTEMIVWGGYGFSGPLGTGGKYDPAADTWTATATVGAPVARYSHVAVWTGGEMIVWGGAGDLGTYLNTGGRYNPSTDSWTTTGMTNVPVARLQHTGIWTGGEMIVWGGQDENGYLNTGGRYSPATNSWTATSTANTPTARWGHSAVWSGTEMLIWGGWTGTAENTGGKYNPTTNSWTATSTTNTPDGRYAQTAIWSGSQMIIWGGIGDFGDMNTGGRYHPGTNSWTATSATNAPSARDAHTAVWTDSEMIVFGGGGGETLNTGGRYDPGTDTWVATATTNVPAGRGQHTTLWTGSEVIVWGGTLNNFSSTNTGGRYDPGLDSWAATTITNAPDARYYHTGIWSGTEMIVWGGDAGMFPGDLNTGGRYSPANDSWVETSTSNAPDPRRWHTAVWSGNEMIVWGGESGNPVNTGGRYNPNTNSWTATSTANAPDPRLDHTAVWSGTEMIVWGGGPYVPSNTGGRYNPSTNSWVNTSTATQPRSGHSAVWTGDQMIVWGGYSGGIHVNTGARYNPSTNSWAATTTTNAPLGRIAHAAVWTGSEVIIWGGFNFEQNEFLNTGGRYQPVTDHWTATSTINAPSPREVAQAANAIWTGGEMIVWGGYDGTFELNTGGRYCAQSGPTPTPTATPTPCTGRCTPTPRPHPSPVPRP